MIFGILWTQYLSSQKPKREDLRLLGSPRIGYGIGADPIGGNWEGVCRYGKELSDGSQRNQPDNGRIRADSRVDEKREGRAIFSLRPSKADGST